jgi:predicted metal-dependent phosphoesterase TrpH
MPTNKPLKLDIHIHSKFSIDGSMEPEEILEAAKKAGMDGIAVTDHNTIKGGKETEKAADKNFIVIVGSEVETKSGEIIGLNLKKEIEAGLSPDETCKLIKKQGALVMIPHPYDRFRKGLGKEMEKIVDYIDAIEVSNSRTMMSVFDRKAVEFAEKHDLSMIASSDSHFADEIGSSFTIVSSGRNKEEVLKAIKDGKTELHSGKTGLKPHWRTFKQNVRRKL